MAGMKVVIRIFCAVSLLVQCAMCGMFLNDVKVLEVLESYVDIMANVNGNGLQDKHLTTVQSHINLFKQTDAFTTKFHKDDHVRRAALNVQPGYCPTATMLACGEAKVDEEDCFKLLHQIEQFVYNELVQILGVDDAGMPHRCEDIKRTPVRSSSRTLSSGQRKQKYAYFEEMLEKQMGCVEAEKWNKFEYRKKLREDEGDLSVFALTSLVDYNYNFEEFFNKHSTNEKVAAERSGQMIERRNLLDRMLRGCHPQAFIECGRFIQQVAPHKREDAVRECFNDIHKYNHIREAGKESRDKASRLGKRWL